MEDKKTLIIAAAVAAFLWWNNSNQAEQAKQLQELLRANNQQIQSINTKGELSKPGEPKIITLAGQNTVTEKIIYQDKPVNQETGEKEKAQVKLQNQPSDIWLNVNGKEMQIPSKTVEDYAFQNGQLVLTSKSSMKIDVTTPMDMTWQVLLDKDKKMGVIATIPIGRNIGVSAGSVSGKAVLGLSGKL